MGSEILEIETPHPRHRFERWPERLGGRAVRKVEARGKHLFLRFDSSLTLHSHLRMSGRWSVYRRDQRWNRSAQRAWLVMRTLDHEVVQFDGPVLELMTDSRARFDLRLAALGPDILADEFDEPLFLRRLREADPTRGIGDALLDQRILAGIGNVWKSEACFLAGVDPRRPTGELGEEEVLETVRGARGLMRVSAERGTHILPRDPRGPRSNEDKWVYGRAGLPCRRCETRIRSRGQGDDNRTAYWCPRCQT